MKRTILVFSLLLSAMTNNASAQKQKTNVTMSNDSVFLNKKFQFIALSREAKGNTLVQLRAPDSSMQALLFLVNQQDTIRFEARFGKLDLMYDCLYPKIELITLYESYIRNGIMVDGVAQEKGLRAYCKERKLELRTLPKRQVVRPGAGGQDSLLKANAEAKMKAMVTIEIVNNAPRPVTVMAGRDGQLVNGKRNFSEKREDVIPAGERRNFIAFDGELICVIAPDKSENDCRAVNHLMKSLSIVPEGDRFGK